MATPLDDTPLAEIDRCRDFPPPMRIPAVSLLRLLQRDQHEAANEFRTLKELKSPNTRVTVPAGHYQFMYSEGTAARDVFEHFKFTDRAPSEQTVTV